MSSPQTTSTPPHWREYLFFVRYPVLSAIVFVAFPWLGLRLLPNMLGNLFALNSTGASLVVAASWLCALSIVYTGRLLWESVPLRAELKLREGSEEPHQVPKILMTWCWHGVAAAIVASVVVRIFVDSELADAVVGLIVGTIGAVIIRTMAACLTKVTGKLDGRLRSHANRNWSPYRVRKDVTNCRGLKNYRVLHWTAAIYALVAFLVFGITGWLSAPSSTWLADQMPALLYVVLFWMAATWLLGFWAFLCDRSRLPPLGMAVVLVMLFGTACPVSFSFDVGATPSRVITTTDVLESRVGHGLDPLIVVSLSGGGISASLWATHVMDRLPVAVGVSPREFHRRVGLISGVSGGSLGGLYYSDAFSYGPIETGTAAAVARSERSSLAAAVWGAIYCDSFRTIFRIWPICDRGKSLEQRWTMNRLGLEEWLGDWAQDTADLARPIMVFNATIQETGRQLLLSPVPVPTEGRGDRIDLSAFLDRDIRLVTAARLSATFPYVSPQARPSMGPALHVSDGGYIDNSGVVTAIDILDRWVRRRADSAPPATVLLIQVRASGVPEKEALIDAKRSWWHRGTISWFGPVETLAQVHQTIQEARAAREIEAVKDQWQRKGVTLVTVVLSMSNRRPLSWHLTAADIQHIKSHWPTATLPADERVREAAIANCHALREVAGVAGWMNAPSCPEVVAGDAAVSSARSRIQMLAFSAPRKVPAARPY